MGDIITVAQLANTFDMAVTDPRGDELIRQAEGLIIERIGTHDPWPIVAETVALAAAGRPLRNPKGVKDKTVDAVRDTYRDEDLGVYLTDSEKARLDEWLNEQTNPNPTLAFGTIRTTSGYPSIDDRDYHRYGADL